MHTDFSFLADLCLIFAAAVGVALTLGRLGLPPVLAYIGTGLLLGPAGLGLVDKTHLIDVLAEVGGVLLLFTMGLEISLAEIRRVWRGVLLAGGLQVSLTIGASAAVGTALGIGLSSAITWGFMVSLSSTAVVLRMLDARGEVRAAHGRVVIGVLIFQDLCVVPMMLLLPVLGGGGGLASIARVLAEAAAIVGFILIVSRVLAPRLMGLVAKTQNREVFLLAVLAIAGGTAYVTSLTGLSLALGAFLAGIVLAETEYSHQALADVIPLRSVMVCVFFVAIGMLIDIDTVVAMPLRVAGLYVGIVVLKFTAMAIAGLALRIPVRITALASSALAQVGEFSFVLAGAAATQGLISADDQRVFLAASVLTIATTPMMLAAFPRMLAGTRALAPLERLIDGRELPECLPIEDVLTGHVVVAGLGVGGRTVIDALERAGITTVIIELNPETVLSERARGRNVVYGDVTSAEVLEHAAIGRARALVLVVSDNAAARRAAEVARNQYPTLPIVMRTRFASDEGELRTRGVDVISEEFAGALSMAGLTLQRCDIEDWNARVGALIADHESLEPGSEGTLAAPPPR